MHDVGLACLSPGFQTQDPTMREQLQRSISVRDQQRHIIESRLQKTAKPSDPDALRSSDQNPGFGAGLRTPTTSTKKRPPPAGLSIVPPSHEQFANERVIQSAPLHQSFTGRNQPHHPLTRQVENRPSNLSNTSHIHHVPANQTSNTLPSISDVFAGDNLAPRREPLSSRPNGLYQSNSNSGSSHSNHPPPFPSPGFPPPSSHPSAPSRGREHRSAEEAINEMTGGREDLFPKIVHYSSSGTTGQRAPAPQPPPPPPHQQPHPRSPPSPPHSGPGPHAPYVGKQSTVPAATAVAVLGNGADHSPVFRSSGGAAGGSLGGSLSGSGTSGRRRQRAEYERDNGSPPLGSGPDLPRRTGPFGEGIDSPETSRRKKDEFMGLCARAWDLFHS